MPISALHGTGTGDLLDVLVSMLKAAPAPEIVEDNSIKIAIVGRPNVGKSSLLNRLLGEERAIVSPIPGTTRDAVDTPLLYNGVPLTLMRLAPEHKAAVVELGMNHPGEIARLTTIAAPTVGLVNNAQREHQEFMHTVEAVALEVSLKVDGELVIIHIPKTGISGGPAAVYATAGLYAR